MKGYRRKIIIIISVFCLVTCFFAACNRQPEKISATNTGMGTVVQETIYTFHSENGQEVIDKLQEELLRLEQECLSWRIENSQVATLNGQAGEAEGIVLTDEVYGYLEEIWEVSEKSKGALDVTIGMVTKLWDLDNWAAMEMNVQEFQVPQVSELQSKLQNTGYEKVLLQNGKVILPEGMSLDLGAVGKGIACDRMGDCLKENATITGAVISVGGSVVTYGTKPNGEMWNVAIIHPRQEGAFLGSLSLQGEWYISTSGDYERFVEKDGIRYHHILDPETGYPSNSGLCSVTILSDSGLLSDALSTACFVLGKEEGMKLAEAFEVEALFVTNNMELVMTKDMKKYFKEK